MEAFLDVLIFSYYEKAFSFLETITWTKSYIYGILVFHSNDIYHIFLSNINLADRFPNPILR